MAMDLLPSSVASSSSSSLSSPLAHSGSSKLPGAGVRSMAAAASTTSSSARLSMPLCSGLRRIQSSSSPSSSSSSSSSSIRTRASTRVISCEQKQEAIAPSAAAAAGAVTEKTWKELVLDADVPVLVDFWAPWCGPCRMIAPLVDELAAEYAGRCRCLKLNTDESQKIASDYGIRSIPTVLLFKNGEKKDTVIGAVPKSTLVMLIEKYLDR